MAEVEVVSDALIDAAVAVTATVVDLRFDPLREVFASAAVGHADLADALRDFGTSWTRGVGALVDDSDTFATRLRAAASAYVGVDVLMAAALRADGP